jgi:DNA-binding MarR family transcriptional regulator
MPKKSRITVSEKILLHLLEKARFEDKFEVPYSLTQDGIAGIVKARRSYVSQAAKELSEKGLIEGRLSHVKDEARRRKAYFLTPEGKMKAQSLYDNLKELQILDEGKNTIVDDILKNKMKGSSILEVLDIISEEGVFDIHLIPTAKPGLSIDSFQKHSPPKYFFGREKELETIGQFLDSQDLKILVVKGIPCSKRHCRYGKNHIACPGG